jgi:hypothetical protein
MSPQIRVDPLRIRIASARPAASFWTPWGRNTDGWLRRMRMRVFLDTWMLNRSESDGASPPPSAWQRRRHPPEFHRTQLGRIVTWSSGEKCRAGVNWIATRFFHKTFPHTS